MKDLKKAYVAYEKWLGTVTEVDKVGLTFRREAMTQSAFAFLRGNFFLWHEQFYALASKKLRGPSQLVVGDLHVDNFGTWRDRDGRWIWGINDFDQVCDGWVGSDLARLAVSAKLALNLEGHAIEVNEILRNISKGYANCLEKGGRPVVLDSEYFWLFELAVAASKTPSDFWQHLSEQATPKQVPTKVKSLLMSSLPQGSEPVRFFHREAGLGGLGMPRVGVQASWRGGFVCREAKAAAPPLPGTTKIVIPQLLRKAIRCPDPDFALTDNWIIRRLAHDQAGIEFSRLRKDKEIHRILELMGWETANIHLGPGKRSDLRLFAPVVQTEAFGELTHTLIEKIEHESHEFAKLFSTSSKGKTPVA